jgi:uncharacterized tellurite resistance protein B-like protein
MDKLEFKKLLFEVAFCTMACDGDIDKREIEELKIMDKNTSYFAEIDLSDELEILIKELETKGVKVIEDLFKTLRKTKLNPIQELLILEVALRIIYADKKVDDNEVKFLNLLRSMLEVHDEIIFDRFGEVEILYINEYISKLNQSDDDFLANLNLPDMVDIKNIDLTKVRK